MKKFLDSDWPRRAQFLPKNKYSVKKEIFGKRRNKRYFDLEVLFKTSIELL